MYYKNKNYGVVVTTVFVALLLSAIALPVCDAREITELHIGYLPCMHQIAEMMAMEKGWWREELSAFGIENVTDTAFSSGQSEMSAMMAGELDIAYVGTAPPITAIDRGLDAKIVAGVQNNGSDLILLPELAAAYTSPEDLRGLKIATLPHGSIQHTVIMKWLRDSGLNDEDVEIVEMDPRDALSAIGEREIEGAFLPAPSLTVLELERERKVERILHSGELWPNHACCCLLVRGELIREHPKLVEQIIRIHINATDYVNEHPDEAAELYATLKGDALESVKASFEQCDAAWIHDPHRQIQYGIAYAQVNYERGLTDKLLTEDDLYDTRFYDTIMTGGPSTPGFEALFAITAVLSVAYLMRRRRN